MGRCWRRGHRRRSWTTRKCAGCTWASTSACDRHGLRVPPRMAARAAARPRRPCRAMNRPTLALRVSQQLALTPQLQQSIRLLQLSTLELSQEVEQMLADNPFLEQAEDGPGADEAPVAANAMDSGA